MRPSGIARRSEAVVVPDAPMVAVVGHMSVTVDESRCTLVTESEPHATMTEPLGPAHVWALAV